MAERTNLARLNVPTQKYVNVLTNVLTYANELTAYTDSFVYYNEDDIRLRTYSVKCFDDTETRLAIFTEDNGYYAAVEIDGEWCEFSLLYSMSRDTIRFNTPTGQHFYAYDYILRECGTPISAMLIGMMSDCNHVGEGLVYGALDIAKKQGII